MKLTLIAVGRRMPEWVQRGVQDYARRLPTHWRFSVTELAQAAGNDAHGRRLREGDTMLKSVTASAHLVALDVSGTAWSSEEFAGELARWQGLGKPVNLLVGGPDGLDQRCLARAAQCWSLSALTLPHPLVRIVVIEQLYRAWSLSVNHPYHRA